MIRATTLNLKPARCTFTIAASKGPGPLEAYVKASTVDPEDTFGISVDLHGNLLVVGADGEDSNATGIDGDQSDNSVRSAGAVFVFERRAGGDWVQIAYVKPSNAPSNAGGGFAKVVADRDTIAVGAFGEASGSVGVNGDDSDTSQRLSGAGYVFR